MEALKKVQEEDLLRFFDRSVAGVAGAVSAASLALPLPPFSCQFLRYQKRTWFLSSCSNESIVTTLGAVLLQ